MEGSAAESAGEERKRNYKLVLAYDGTRYYGWERQPDNEMTIQGKLESVLSRMTQTPVEVIASGRTDAGVHARAQVASVLLATDLTPDEIRDYCNRFLPEDIAVSAVNIASDRFHARYNALGKTYRYTCYTGPSKPVFDRRFVTVLEERPDTDAMRRAAGLLTGTHDFRSFCGNTRFKKSTVRSLDTLEILESGAYIRLYYHGNGFLTNMVRILTGTLLEVGYGRIDPEDMGRILEERDRRAAGPTAPARGLCLMKVDY